MKPVIYDKLCLYNVGESKWNSKKCLSMNHISIRRQRKETDGLWPSGWLATWWRVPWVFLSPVCLGIAQEKGTAWKHQQRPKSVPQAEDQLPDDEQAASPPLTCRANWALLAWMLRMGSVKICPTFPQWGCYQQTQRSRRESVSHSVVCPTLRPHGL